MVKAKVFASNDANWSTRPSSTTPLRVFPDSCHWQSNFYEMSVLVCQVELRF